MACAEMFCSSLVKGFNNAERLRRYKRAFPEDGRADSIIIDELNHDKKMKKFLDHTLEWYAKRRGIEL